MPEATDGPEDAEAPWGTAVAALASFAVPQFVSSNVALDALRVAAASWKDDAVQLDSGHGSLADLSLSEAEDARYVASLVTFNTPSPHPAFYLIPVVAAWSFLGFAEYRYQVDQGGSATKTPFFAWWSEQSFGPWAFSAVVGGLVAFVVLLELRTRSRQRTVLAIERKFDAQCVALAMRVRRELRADSARGRLERLLQQSTQRWESATASLSQIARDLSSSTSTGGAALTVVRELGGAVTDLDTQISTLVGATTSLSASLDDLPGRFASWSSNLDELANLGASLRDNAASSVQASSTFAESMSALSHALPGIDAALSTTHELAVLVQSTERTFTELISTLQEALQVSASDHAGNLATLESALEATIAAASSMKDTAQRLHDGIVTMDALAPEPITR